jgi:archaellum component FlaC
MEETLARIEERLTRIEQRLDIITDDCSHMNNHIQFVEKTYTVVRTPLNYLKNKIELLMGTNRDGSELPSIKNDDNK